MVRAAAVALIVILGWVAPDAAAARCACDCDDDGRVEVAELIRTVRIALGDAELSSCPAALDDRCLACVVDIGVLVGCVRNALDGCEPTVTPGPESPTPTEALPGCTPPPCAAGSVLTCAKCPEPCSDGCGVICATKTPVCTAPACGEDEVLFFPPCSGCAECGTRTPTPPPTPTGPFSVCTPPSCSPSEVLFCGNCPEPCPDGCGYTCATPTITCTAPVCRDDETLWSPPCGESCAICATRTPTPPSTATSTSTSTRTPTPPACGTPTGCPTSLVLVRPTDRCPFCATATPTPE